MKPQPSGVIPDLPAREQEIYVGHRGPEGRGPEGDAWQQDSDTLDTWFSSALWTWSTLVDPELAKDQEIGLSQLLARKAWHVHEEVHAIEQRTGDAALIALDLAGRTPADPPPVPGVAAGTWVHGTH